MNRWSMWTALRLGLATCCTLTNSLGGLEPLEGRSGRCEITHGRKVIASSGQDVVGSGWPRVLLVGRFDPEGNRRNRSVLSRALVYRRSAQWSVKSHTRQAGHMLYCP
ncbi:hypothetical protein DFH94DRAFT_775859 [Russula ochroleuca]|uniref:Secreted protein n=1 Tax=Russula ochroleuca TaxID=152965 RepID=A0A9P5JXE8_9AGAM|nr:hypothetical protein DFH94DRAFT_775859 [Russula ochroleuca]